MSCLVSKLLWCSSHFEPRKKEEIVIIPVKTTAEDELTRYEDTFVITFAASFLKHRKLNAQFFWFLIGRKVIPKFEHSWFTSVCFTLCPPSFIRNRSGAQREGKKKRPSITSNSLRALIFRNCEHSSQQYTI